MRQSDKSCQESTSKVVKWLPCGSVCFYREKERGAVSLAYKHTAALSAFMFIQLLASGTSQQNYSLCKFNLWAVTGNSRPHCCRDAGVCQSAGLYGLVGILSKRQGMMGKLSSRCLCPITVRLFDSPSVSSYFQQLLYTYWMINLKKRVAFCDVTALFSCLHENGTASVFAEKWWKISDLLSRMDFRTWTRLSSSQTVFPVSVLLIYVLQFRNL